MGLLDSIKNQSVEAQTAAKLADVIEMCMKGIEIRIATLIEKGVPTDVIRQLMKEAIDEQLERWGKTEGVAAPLSIEEQKNNNHFALIS